MEINLHKNTKNSQLIPSLSVFFFMMLITFTDTLYLLFVLPCSICIEHFEFIPSFHALTCTRPQKDPKMSIQHSKKYTVLCEIATNYT